MHKKKSLYSRPDDKDPKLLGERKTVQNIMFEVMIFQQTKSLKITISLT